MPQPWRTRTLEQWDGQEVLAQSRKSARDRTFPGQLKSRIHLRRRCVAQFRNWRSFTKSREGRVARSATNPQQSNGGIRFLCIARSVLGELENEPESLFVMRHCRI